MNYDPKERLTHHGENISFSFCADLSGGVDVHLHKVAVGGKYYDLSTSHIMHETACFVTWWMINIHPQLKKFSGMDTVKFNIVTT